ncbi:beta-N-acetylglucosaminidase domain-containing protein [Candidatus Ponderosibacter sp. Uisw_141_02]|uniref:beta-N-acetylglucosaminidase domain-containing protein n=1 Tax=Candidatus Ponderosibacter sp. Uisw_141_02 TaxID=3231000 RepID=UPI003D4EFA23
MTLIFTGYIEGYYGRLFDWHDRNRLLGGVAAAEMTSYFYAPKEDARHRQFWRQPYDKAWQAEFTQFATIAAAKNIHLIAGIAPGLDFDFASLDASVDQKNDFTTLVAKVRQFLANGASMIALLMDDIAADFEARSGSFTNEGRAHAALANRLGLAIDAAIIIVPRIYADSLITPDDTQSLAYLEQFTSHLDPQHQVVYCGDDIVAPRPFGDAGGHLDPASIIIWDNFYANDYCPRRLFLGPWRNTDMPHIMLNPTGMIETDLLLLGLMAGGRDQAGRGSEAGKIYWRELMQKAAVPDVFFDIAAYFDAPYGFAAEFAMPSAKTALAALDILLWRWKSPLQREWYPHLMGLKQDILLANGELPLERIEKTQMAPLARQLSGFAAKG